MEIIGLILILGLFAVAFFLKSQLTDPINKKTVYRYTSKPYFLTERERECYQDLVRAVSGRYVVFAQVHLSSILDEKIKGQNWQAARAHINRKSIDFLLCEPEYLVPKLAIELDDSSHNREDRIERDRVVERILKEANIPLLRIMDTRDVQTKIEEALNAADTTKL